MKVKVNTKQLSKSLREYKTKLEIAFVRAVQGTVAELLDTILEANPVGDAAKYQKFYISRNAHSGYAVKEGLSSGSWIVEYNNVTPDREVSYGQREASRLRFEAGKNAFKLGDTIYIHNSVDYIASIPADPYPGFLGDIGGERFIMQAVKISYSVSIREFELQGL